MKLAALQSNHNHWSILALDGGAQLVERLGLSLTEATTDQAIHKLFTAMQQVLAPSCSGIVLDPIYTHQLVRTKPVQTGVAFRLEKLTTEVDPLALPVLIGNWGVGAIRQNYGVAKLELYYHPGEENALAKKQLVAELADYCHHEGIDLLLKLTIYTPADEKFSVTAFQSAQLEALHELAHLVDLVVIQYPQDALASATVTAELDIPWLLASDDVSYDSYKDILRTSLNNGAQGMYVGEVLWQELYELKLDDGTPDWEKMQQFLQTTARDRVIELVRIVDEDTQELG